MDNQRSDADLLSAEEQLALALSIAKQRLRHSQVLKGYAEDAAQQGIAMLLERGSAACSIEEQQIEIRRAFERHASGSCVRAREMAGL